MGYQKWFFYGTFIFMYRLFQSHFNLQRWDPKCRSIYKVHVSTVTNSVNSWAVCLNADELTVHQDWYASSVLFQCVTSWPWISGLPSVRNPQSLHGQQHYMRQIASPLLANPGLVALFQNFPGLNNVKLQRKCQFYLEARHPPSHKKVKQVENEAKCLSLWHKIEISLICSRWAEVQDKLLKIASNGERETWAVKCPKWMTV